MTKSIYTIYQITNKINNKIYIGVHKATDPNDNYMGSGLLIKRAIKKHGTDNFTKEILFEYDDKEDAYLKEAEIVNEDFITNSNSYNLKIGGIGGSNVHSDASKAKMSRTTIEWYQNNPMSDETKLKIAKSTKKRFLFEPVSYETKERMSKSQQERHQTTPFSDESKTKMSVTQKEWCQTNHKVYYITPTGKFKTSTEASISMNDVISSVTIRNWCINADKEFTKGSIAKSPYLSDNDLGKTPRDLGFDFIPV